MYAMTLSDLLNMPVVLENADFMEALQTRIRRL